ncbi:D-2-hydroxyacid dehydrogenase family protein [Mucilaginibacter sp. 22184]|uniref:D-2-hydroxyacid dehydrogenase family protein n=1 Tax=Mucilaginibacter sp. 22184 TaxID=3453887 RepID=UPI003F826B95
MEKIIKIAVLDDYQNVAMSLADWSAIKEVAEVTVYNDHQKNEDDIVARLLPYHVLSVMRERTPFPESLLTRLPNLRLIVSTGPGNKSIDAAAAEQLGIMIRNTEFLSTGAPELSWALLMAAAKNIPQEQASIRAGGWQTALGRDLAGKTLGIIGLGNIGQKMAIYARAFDMKVIAWSENLTAEKAAKCGVAKYTKEGLLAASDFITVHLPLSERSKGMIGPDELALMKSSAILINTSRGPIINETALISALKSKKIAAAALDVFHEEPLPLNHPFRTLENVITTPHTGYVTEDNYRIAYGDTVRIISEIIQLGMFTSL